MRVQPVMPIPLDVYIHIILLPSGLRRLVSYSLGEEPRIEDERKGHLGLATFNKIPRL